MFLSRFCLNGEEGRKEEEFLTLRCASASSSHLKTDFKWGWISFVLQDVNIYFFFYAILYILLLNKWYHKFYTIRGHFQIASMLPAKFVFWKFDFVSVSISSFSFSLFSEGSDDEGDKGGVPEKNIYM